MSQTRIDSSGAGPGSLKSYVIGLVLSVALSALAFGLVAYQSASRPLLLIGIFGAAIVQILVHLHFFLHLKSSSTARWNILALLMTVLIITLFVGGTLWIMYHLKYRVM